MEGRYRLLDWLAWADLEIDNVRAVMQRCLTRGDAACGIDLAACLGWFWITGAPRRAEGAPRGAGGTPRGAAPRGAGEPGGETAPLAKREADVARLVADGLTNKQIGARLFISERIVDSHVRSILNKLGVGSRAQIAAWVATLDH
jgi:DNA-binding CsgD family transcriptional regulator